MKIFKKRLTVEHVMLIFINLIPVYGVWFEGWAPLEVFYVYIFESVIVGVLTITKLALTGSVKRHDTWENNGSKSQQSFLLFIFFFLIHYGFFVYIQLMIFLQIAPGKKISAINFLLHFTEYIGPNGYIMLGVFIIGYCYKALFNFLLNGAYRTASLSTLMFEPYVRIFIQQFTVIIGSFFLMFNGGGKIFILVFALARILFEVWFDYERRLKLLLRKHQERSNSHS